MDASNPTPHIPDELLIMIFHSLLCEDWPINVHIHDEVVRYTLLPLSLVCKQFRDIATELYYTSNTFLIERENSGPFVSSNNRPFRYTLFKFGGHVRRLELRLRYPTVFVEESHELLSVDCDMSRLWRPKRALRMSGEHWREDGGTITVGQYRWYHSTQVYWQRHFTNLNFVSVRVEINMSCVQSDLDKIKDLSRLASVDLRCRKVEVETLVHSAEESWYISGGLPENTRYKTVLEKTLEETMCLKTPPKDSMM